MTEMKSGAKKRTGLYFRLTPEKPHVGEQSRPLMKLARRKGWDVVYSISDGPTSARKIKDDRRGLNALLLLVARGELDLVATPSMGSLARSLGDLRSIHQKLWKRGVRLYIHEPRIDTTTTTGKALFEKLGVFVDWQQSIVRERVGSGMSRAHAQMVRLGRPPIEHADAKKVEDVKAALAARTGVRRIAADLHVGVGTVIRIRDGGATRRPSRPTATQRQKSLNRVGDSSV